MVFPVAAATAIATALNGQLLNVGATAALDASIVAIPCSASSFTTAIGFGGQTYTISSEDMLLGALDESGETCGISILARNVSPPSPNLGSSDLNSNVLGPRSHPNNQYSRPGRYAVEERRRRVQLRQCW